jgi:hypothetical protein
MEETSYAYMCWVHLVQYKVWWQAIVNPEGFPWVAEQLLTSKKDLVHGIS